MSMMQALRWMTFRDFLLLSAAIMFVLYVSAVATGTLVANAECRELGWDAGSVTLLMDAHCHEYNPNKSVSLFDLKAGRSITGGGF